jgi:hypothetical protein
MVNRYKLQNYLIDARFLLGLEEIGHRIVIVVSVLKIILFYFFVFSFFKDFKTFSSTPTVPIDLRKK